MDLLYLDNTFSDPSCMFPSREVCQEEIIKLAKAHPQHDILIGVRSLGKECLLAEIGVALNEDVVVTAKTLQVLLDIGPLRGHKLKGEHNKCGMRIITLFFFLVQEAEMMLEYIEKFNELFVPSDLLILKQKSELKLI